MEIARTARYDEAGAAAALADVARARRRAGLPGLDEARAAWFLRDLADVRALPEAGTQSSGPVIPSPRRPARTAARRQDRSARAWWAFR